MADVKDIYQQIDLICILLPNGDEKRIDDEFNKLFELEKEVFGGEYRTPEDMVVFFDMSSVIADNHIRLNHTEELSIYGIKWGMALKEFLEKAPFTNAEKRPVQEAYFKLHTRIRDYMNRVVSHNDAKETTTETNEINIRKSGCKCLLCRKKPADKTGSHMVPEMLLEKVFNFNGKKGRGLESAERFVLDEERRDLYFGSGVLPDQRETLINRPQTDAEVEESSSIHNPFTFDYYFCSECEKRLSTIESWYAEISQNRQGKYPPMIPLLFWMSVVWRMSISKMSIVLPPQHEEKYRKALDKALALKREDVKVTPSVGDYTAYALHYCNNTKGETPILIGAPVPMVPTTVIIGDTILTFFHNKEKVKKMDACGFSGAQNLNCGIKPEVVGECSFIGYWLTKRKLLDLNWEYNGPDAPYEPNGVAQFIAKRNWEMEHLHASGEMINFTPTMSKIPEGYYHMNIPNSIMKIRHFIDSHPNGATPEEFEAELGYTPDEVETMMDYWDKMNPQLN